MLSVKGHLAGKTNFLGIKYYNVGILSNKHQMPYMSSRLFIIIRIQRVVDQVFRNTS